MDRDALDNIIQEVEKLKVDTKYNFDYGVPGALSIDYYTQDIHYIFVVQGTADGSNEEQYLKCKSLFDYHGVLNGTKIKWIFVSSNPQLSKYSNVLILDQYFESMVRTFEHGKWDTNPLFNNVSDVNNKTHRFLCYGGVPRAHRIIFLSKLVDSGIVDLGLVSFHRHLEKHEYIEICEKNDFSDNFIHYVSNGPYKIDDDEYTLEKTLNYMNPIWDEYLSPNPSHIQKVYFNVSLETSFYEPHLFITEKTYKFLPCIPTIVVGQKGVLSRVRDLGFKTFPMMFDESYDEIDDGDSRMNFIFNEVKKLCEMDEEQLNDLYLSCRENIDYNLKLIKGDL